MVMVGDKSGHVLVPAQVDITIVPCFFKVGGFIGLNRIFNLRYLSCNIVLLVDELLVFLS